MAKQSITVTLDDETIRHLAVLGDPIEVLAHLADSAADGVRRPDRMRREQTDESLRIERDKSDVALANERAAIDEKADDVVRLARERADRVVQTARDEAADERRRPSAASEASSDNARMVLEHERSDADAALEHERTERTHDKTDLLIVERDATDKDLVGERALSDSLIVDQREANEQMVRATIRAHELSDKADAAKQRAEESERKLRTVAEFREMFIGVLGHDLRNPLGSIAMATTLLLQRGNLDEQDSKSVSRIIRSNERMSRMITQLLDLTRARLGGGLPIEPELTDLREVCQNVVEEFEATILLKVEGDVTGTWDRDRLEEVLSNLTGNAIEYATPGTVVTIEAHADGAEVVVEVTNHGQPIPAELLPFIFEPFRRAKQHEKSASGSLGLGLYIASQIVRSHAGTLVAHSADGTTTFAMRLPRSPPPPGILRVEIDGTAELMVGTLLLEGTTAEEADCAALERQSAEAERTRLQALLKQVPATINFLRGPELVFEFAHPNTLKALGGRDILGKPLLEAVPEHRGQPLVEMLQRVYRTGEPIFGKEMLANLDRTGTGVLDESYWNFSYLPVRSPTGDIEGVMTFDIDVTESVLARTRQESLLEELKLADQRKDEFLAMLAHELRNPIAGISLALSMLERTEGDADKTAMHRKTAQRQIGNLVRLVGDLLDVARISRAGLELRKEEVDLAALVQVALTATRPLIEARGHDLSVTIASGPFRMEADATRLEQVVVNLLANAAKYTEPGGSLSVRLSREVADGALQAILRVCDTGRGIPEEVLEDVFGMFFQVSPTLERSMGGLGLGLTLVKRLVEMHDGSVVAHSGGPGKGSEFVVRLPLLRSQEMGLEATSHSDRQTKAPASPGRQRILLVEDGEDLREGLQKFLEHLGHEVIVAVNGLEGVAKLLALRPDLALVDIGLPGIDGFELARRVRSTPGGEELYLVALSGYGDTETKAEAAAAGFDLHLTKPVTMDELSRVVTAAFRRAASPSA